MKGSSECKWGFTLLELLAVIAILGMLFAILFPAIAGVKMKAKIKKAETEVKSLATAIRAYHTEYTRWPVNPNAGGTWSNNNQQVLECLVGAHTNNSRRITFIELTGPITTMCDPFASNMPYRIVIDVLGKTVKVWSCGENCVDERGLGGDDIAVTY